MKHLISLALALFCGIASASSVDWSITGKSFKTSDGSSERASGYFVTVFLYDDYDDVMNIVNTWTAPVSDASALNSYIKSTDTTAKSGGAGGGFDLDDATYPSITTVSLFMIAWDGDSIGGASNYLVSSAVDSDAYSGTDNPTNKGQFTNASFTNSSWTPVAAVPEPGTVALALAGLALLIKRRRA